MKQQPKNPPQKIELDYSRLYGFRTLASDCEAVLAAKIGDKAVAKSQALFSKIGGKVGGKTGIKG